MGFNDIAKGDDGRDGAEGGRGWEAADIVAYLLNAQACSKGMPKGIVITRHLNLNWNNVS